MSQTRATNTIPTTVAAGYDFLRVSISARLRTTSPLHCGDGGEMPAAAWLSTTKLGDQGHINTLCHGAIGAYIPASTLRGNLRSRCAEPARTRLFGSARGEGAAGLVRIYDAARTRPDPSLPDHKAKGAPGDQYWDPSRRTTLRDGVALDAVTATADEGKLFRFEVVPAEQTFALQVEADRITRDDLAELLALISAWQGQLATSIGLGRGRGWGRVICEASPAVACLTDADLIAWTQGDMLAPPRFKPLAQLPPHPAGTRNGGGNSFQLRLRCDTPLLVNDAGRVLGRGQGEEEAHLEFMRDQRGNALIPASSLRGALRALTWRILATIAHQHLNVPEALARERVRPHLELLLGSERRRGLLWLGDAVAAATRDHPQTFSAIDRFTGAAAQETQKIYSVVAADCPDGLTADAHLDSPTCNATDGKPSQRLSQGDWPQGDWWRGLLLLLARDCCEGDLRVGWGRARGYGALNLALVLDDGSLLQDFDSILTAIRQRVGEQAPETWVRALHTELQRAIDNGEAA